MVLSQEVSRVGSCKQCGQCCQNLGWICIYADKDTLEWIRARDPEIQLVPYDSVEDCYLMAVPYPCKQLVDIGDGKYGCKLHETKPYLCKQYPESTDELKPGCGFNFTESAN
jgi:Fe-S-cluster containining protein